MEKTEKKRRKKLIIFLCIVLSLCIGFHFLFEYFSNVVCENLKSVAENTEYIESENDKVKLGTYFEDINDIFEQSLELSKLAYEPENEDENKKVELEKIG